MKAFIFLIRSNSSRRLSIDSRTHRRISKLRELLLLE